MNQNLVKKAKEIADYIRESEFIRIISHNDADGLASAAVLCESLKRIHKPFHTTILGRPSEKIVKKINEEDKCSVVFFDMGSGQPELVKKLNHPVAVVDHHPPSHKYEVTKKHLNPHHFGLDGTFEASASSLSYVVSRELDVRNEDLGKVALAGAIGDMQHLPIAGINLEILNEMRKKDQIEIKEGPRIISDLGNSLEKTTDPYLRSISGNSLKAKKVLEELNIDPEKSFWELNEKQKRIFSSFLILKLLKQDADPDRIKTTIGENYKAKKEKYDFVSELTSLLNACGNEDEYGLALSLVFGEEKNYKKAKEIEQKQNKKLLNKTNKSINRVKEKENLFSVEIDSRDVKGAVAGILVDYVLTDKPVFSYYQDKEKKEISISARGNKSLIKKGLDLSEVVSFSAKEANGSGGGHNIASGATVPINELNKFLDEANELIGKKYD